MGAPRVGKQILQAPLDRSALTGRGQGVVSAPARRQAGAHVDMKTKSSKDKNKGAVALHYAAQQDRHEIVEYLIRQNASVNIQDARGCTPLHYAAYTGSVSVVRVLLKHKADPAKEDAQGRTAEKLLDISPILKIPGSNPASPRVQIMQLLKPASKTAKQNACTIC